MKERREERNGRGRETDRQRQKVRERETDRQTGTVSEIKRKRVSERR